MDVCPGAAYKIYMLKRLLFIVAVLLAGSGFLFFQADYKVKRRLLSRQSSELPAVYSDLYTVGRDSGLPLSTVRSQLLNRRYREVEREVSAPGDFFISANQLSLYTREFRLPSGTAVSSVKLSYHPEDREILTSDGRSLEVFYLEPQIISYLGSGEQRASNYVPLKEIPKAAIKAVIAVEDERFFYHYGIDPLAIARAMAKNLKAMGIVEGGSTITQQLAKNLLFTPRKTIGRKLLEAFAALSLERHLSKGQILELYLNEVYFGQEGSVAIHGVAEACRTFFGKKLEDISIAEAAMLSGVIKAPSYYSPRKHYERALARGRLVVEKMLELNLIDTAQYAGAMAEKPRVIDSALHQRNAPHFVVALTRELEEEFNVEAALYSGLSVYTGIDLEMQRCAEQAVSDGILTLEKNNPRLRRKTNPLQAGLVAIEPHSGKIRAWVGSRDYSENQFDHVNQGKRQIGSTIKAFLYLTALDPGLNDYRTATTMSILSDEPMSIKLVTKQEWVPENYDKNFRGDVTLRYALENSLNMPAVYVGQRVGIRSLANTLKNFGVTENPPAVPALALGAADTTLLELTAGYAGLANGGIIVNPRIYVSALDAEGEVLAAGSIEERRVASENAVYVLTNILQGVLERGTGAAVRRLGYKREAAGKTGTSNDTRDAWFEGFTPTLAAGVWVGYDDNSKIGLTGGAAAAPIWTEFMKCAEPYYQDASFIAPPGVVFSSVDSQSGQLATSECPAESTVREVFISGTEPRRPCPIHGGHLEEQVPDYRKAADAAPRRREGSFWDNLFGR